MKKLKLILCIIIPIIILATALYLIFFNTIYIKCINLKTEFVDNSYNNTIANISSKLIRIEDKLYYNYVNNDPFKYGTYEISELITKRVYWEGIKLYPTEIDLDYVYNNKILEQYSDDLKFLDVRLGKFVIDNTTKIPNKYKDYYFFIYNNQIYFMSEDSLWKYDEKNTVLLTTKDDLQINSFDSFNCYVNNSQIYYQNYIDEKISICCYDIESKKIIYKFCIDDVPNAENGVSNLIADGDDVYFLVDFDELYHVNLKENTIEKLFEAKGVITANYYNQKLYIGVARYLDENGLYVLDLSNNKKVKKVNNKETCGVYILDDEWIYFKDQNEKLYRITPDGKTIEKVFG